MSGSMPAGATRTALRGCAVELIAAVALLAGASGAQAGPKTRPVPGHGRNPAISGHRSGASELAALQSRLAARDARAQATPSREPPPALAADEPRPEDVRESLRGRGDSTP